MSATNREHTMITTFTTKSGSRYEVDLDTQVFRKSYSRPGSLVPEMGWQQYSVLKSRENGVGDFDPTAKPQVGHQVLFDGCKSFPWLRTSRVVTVTEQTE